MDSKRKARSPRTSRSAGRRVAFLPEEKVDSSTKRTPPSQQPKTRQVPGSTNLRKRSAPVEEPTQSEAHRLCHTESKVCKRPRIANKRKKSQNSGEKSHDEISLYAPSSDDELEADPPRALTPKSSEDMVKMSDLFSDLTSQFENISKRLNSMEQKIVDVGSGGTAGKSGPKIFIGSKVRHDGQEPSTSASASGPVLDQPDDSEDEVMVNVERPKEMGATSGGSALGVNTLIDHQKRTGRKKTTFAKNSSTGATPDGPGPINPRTSATGKAAPSLINALPQAVRERIEKMQVTINPGNALSGNVAGAQYTGTTFISKVSMRKKNIFDELRKLVVTFKAADSFDEKTYNLFRDSVIAKSNLSASQLATMLRNIFEMQPSAPLPLTPRGYKVNQYTGPEVAFEVAAQCLVQADSLGITDIGVVLACAYIFLHSQVGQLGHLYAP